MTNEQTTEEAWREVGGQFKTLGESLARAFRTAWESEENRQHLQNMSVGLEAMVDEIGQAIKDASASPEGQKVRQEVQRAAESARAAGEQAMQEARPHLLSALHQINAELQKMIGRLEEKPPVSKAPAAESAPDEQGKDVGEI
jgi:vacuolar-type H+-ATPase subunit I/STV1